MATFSRIKIWVAGEVLTASALNGEFDNIINNMTPSGVEDASADVTAMQTSVSPGGLGTESLATSLLGEIQRLRYVISRFVAGDLTKKWYESPGRSFAVGDLDVTSADILPGAVSPDKLGTINQQVSSSSSAFVTASISFVDVTNLTCTITTNGRPVRLEIISAGITGGSGPLQLGQVTTAANGPAAFTMRFVRDTTNLVDFAYSADTISITGLTVTPPTHVDIVAAGTYVYKVQVINNTSNRNIFFSNAKLLVTEL